jgi:hypothetical protein
MLLIAAALVIVGVGAALSVPGAGAEHHGKKCHCPPGPRGPRGPRGSTGPRGATGPAGPSGGGANSLNFDARLAPSTSKSITIGNFTVNETSTAAGNCNDVMMRAGNLDGKYSVGVGVFVAITNNTNATLVPTSAAGNSRPFTAVSNDGSSTVSGIIGCANSGGVALTSGYITGI